MRGVVLAVIIALIILVGVYVATRRLPGPNPPVGPCKQDSDCPPPQSCVKGVCIDLGLPALIKNAQGAIAGLYGTLHRLASDLAGKYPRYVRDLRVAAVEGGLGDPPSSSFAASLAASQAALAKVLVAYAVPGCNPANSTSCGYYAQMMAASTATPAGILLAVAGLAGPAVQVLPTATSTFGQLASTLDATVQWVKQAEEEHGVGVMNPALKKYVNLLSDEVSRLNDAADPSGSLARQAASVRQTGYDLYSHILGQ